MKLKLFCAATFYFVKLFLYLAFTIKYEQSYDFLQLSHILNILFEKKKFFVSSVYLKFKFLTIYFYFRQFKRQKN